MTTLIDAAGRLVVDLRSLTAAEGFILQGHVLNEEAGAGVSGAGDINGDGFDDIVIGAPYGTGRAVIVFGTDQGFGDVIGPQRFVNLDSLTPPDGLTILPEQGGDFLGRSVASAGDVNGDGIDDLIVGAPSADAGTNDDAGKAYVIFGSETGLDDIQLPTLTAAQGFIIQGDANGAINPGDAAGYSVAGAGDLNGDGIDDIIIGAKYSDDAGGLSGQAYVVFGSTEGFGVNVGGHQVIDVTLLSSSQGFVIRGDNPGDQAGFSVAAAGDVNGDGLADIVIGAPYADGGGTNAGDAYVIFGSSSGFGNNQAGRRVLDLTNLTTAQGFIVHGDNNDDLAGRSVSSAGDVNGDGFDDVIVGASDSATGGTDAGEAYLIFGSDSAIGSVSGGRLVLDSSTLAASQGFIIRGAAGSLAGFDVSSAGDLNGDGFGDLIVAAPYAQSLAGEVYVIYGSESGFGSNIGGRQVVLLASLAPSVGFVLRAEGQYDQLGTSVAAAGDVDGDGFDDLIVGAPHTSTGAHYTGTAYVIFGKSTGSARPLSAPGTTGADSIVGDDDKDTFTGGPGTDVILGEDPAQPGGDADLLYGGGEADYIDGGAGNDRLNGEGEADWLIGNDGDDTIRGGAQRDYLEGSAGSDLLYGGAAADVLAGGDSDDTLYGGDGISSTDDWLFGDDAAGSAGVVGNDLVYGGNGRDFAFGGAGNDRLYGGNDADYLEGGTGNDTVSGDSGADLVSGGDGDDSLLGGNEVDTLFGGAGNDVLNSGAANGDLMIGGAGNDTYLIGSGAGSDTIGDWNEGDIIAIDFAVAGGFAGLTIVPVTGGVQITASGLNLIVLLDPGEALDASDFTF